MMHSNAKLAPIWTGSSTSLFLRAALMRTTTTFSWTAAAIILTFLSVSSSFAVVSAGMSSSNGAARLSIKENPLTPRASLIRFWNRHISSKQPIPTFFLSKASPLSAVDSSFFAKKAAQGTLSSHLSAFCVSANLFCRLDADYEASAAPAPPHEKEAEFTSYSSNKGFANYGTARHGGSDEFKNYSRGTNFATVSFSRYSRGSVNHREGFTSYASDGNVGDANFTSYASTAGGGHGDFKTYLPRVNVPDLRFASYDSSSHGHGLSFSSYVDDTNSGSQGFTSYGKNGRAIPLDFTSYGHSSNVIGSTFTGYGELGNSANDSFKSYSSNANNPTNNFKNYGSGGDSAVDSFSSYRDTANAGADMFQSYGRKSNYGKTDFVNYGKSFNDGTDTFKEYGKGSVGQSTGFSMYALNTTFKEYTKKGVGFSNYARSGEESKKTKTRRSSRWVVEEGKFFREHMLREGSSMKMPDISDRMPKRSFLPRAISEKLPFGTARMSDLKGIFGERAEREMRAAAEECEREPSRGERKRCVGSAEEMVEFAAGELGTNDVVLRTTEGVDGSGKDVTIGKVKGGERVRKTVSCHQSMYPYLMYYCHAVPGVKVYEAEILDSESNVRINHGVAVCHLDTSDWSAGHAAFLALGSRPGLIEVCHWIFENDMTWTVAY